MRSVFVYLYIFQYQLCEWAVQKYKTTAAWSQKIGWSSGGDNSALVIMVMGLTTLLNPDTAEELQAKNVKEKKC